MMRIGSIFGQQTKQKDHIGEDCRNTEISFPLSWALKAPRCESRLDIEAGFSQNNLQQQVTGGAGGFLFGLNARAVNEPAC